MILNRSKPKKPKQPTPKEVKQDLEAENLELKLSLAEMYETEEQNTLEAKLALAELYEATLI